MIHQRRRHGSPWLLSVTSAAGQVAGGGGGLVGGGRAVGGVVHDFHVGADFVGTSVVASTPLLLAASVPRAS